MALDEESEDSVREFIPPPPSYISQKSPQNRVVAIKPQTLDEIEI